MVRRDISAGAMPTGLHITMLLACAGFLGIVCIINFSLRWTLWCVYQYSIDNGVIGNSGFGMFRHDAP